MTELLAHSPLGGSGASRWMPCPGSVGLSEGIPPEEDDDEFSAPGNAAHAVAAYCLTTDCEAWELIGTRLSPGKDGKLVFTPPNYRPANIEGIVVDKEMADAVQMYLDAIRYAHPDQDQGNTWVERRFHCPEIHELYYSQSDFTHLSTAAPGFGFNTLDVWDFKYGAGIVVEVKNNVQCMYYACGMLEDLGLWNTVDRVKLHIVQPRGFHFDGPIRSWSISTDDLWDWLWDILVPAMDTALVSNKTASGEHCRFCPARGRKCPQLMKDLDELEELVKKMNAGTAAKLKPAENARILTLMVPAMIARKQALKNATGQLSVGHKVPGWKLAAARKNREFKEGAEAAAKKLFGKRAMTEVVLKSPAQIEALPEGKKFTTRWAFKPEGSLTVVPEGDARMEVSKETKSMFKPKPKKGKK